MKHLAVRTLGVLSALLAAVPAPAQELSKSVLEKIKASTVYVEASTGGVSATGSGFLFRKSGTTGYIMTCDHVVEGADKVVVVFSSGTKGEQRYEAEVAGADPDLDLACLLIREARDLPGTLDIGSKTQVKETEVVYAAGFPFGALLAGEKRNPEITVAKASVSSVRKDERGETTAVQLGGDVNPGHSGGPIVNAQGVVIGVAQSGILGTSMSFAVPPEQVQSFFKGRVKSVFSKPIPQGDGVVKLDITLTVIDPFSTFRNVTFSYIAEGEVKSTPAADKDGKWSKVHPSMKQVSLKSKGRQFVGELEMRRPTKETDEQSILFQISYARPDGSTTWTGPGTLTVDYLAPPGTGAAEAAAGPALAPKGLTLKTADRFTVSSVMRLNAAIADLVMSRDGDHLLALDLSDGKVLKISADGFKVVAESPVLTDAVAMALTPNGRTLYVAISDPPKEGSVVGRVGAVQVLDAASLKPSSTISLDFAPIDIEATDQGLLVLNADGTGLKLLNAGKKGAAEDTGIGASDLPIRLSPDQSRIYVGGNAPLHDVHAAPLTRTRSGEGRSRSERFEHRYGSDLFMSPDGRFLLYGSGHVLRLSKDPKLDLQTLKKIDPFVCAAMAPGINTFFVCTDQAFLKQFEAGSFEIEKTIKLERPLIRILLDPKRKLLYGLEPITADPSTWLNSLNPAVANLVVYSIGAQ
jgi:hypothetical protein